MSRVLEPWRAGGGAPPPRARVTSEADSVVVYSGGRRENVFNLDIEFNAVYHLRSLVCSSVAPCLIYLSHIICPPHRRVPFFLFSFLIFNQVANEPRPVSPSKQ